MFAPRSEENIQEAESGTDGNEGEKMPKSGETQTDAEKIAENENGKDPKAAGGYKVIVPSPSKRMQAIRAKEPMLADPPEKKKHGKRDYKSEVAGANNEDLEQYHWPARPENFSVVEDGSSSENRLVDGNLVQKPAEAHFPMFEDEISTEWALNPNPVKEGRCGSGEERDVERHGEVGNLKEGDFVLVPDGKRNQLYDGGWLTGEERTLPKPYGKSARIQWADTTCYGGSKICWSAWRPVWVPYSRIIKAPSTKRNPLKSGKRSLKNKLTNDIVSKWNLQTEVVYKKNSPHCVFGRNRRESSVWVRPINGEQKLEGSDDAQICYGIEDLDPVTEFNKKWAAELKLSMEKIVKTRKQKERLAQRNKEKTTVNPKLTGALTANSFASSPSASERGFNPEAQQSSTPIATGSHTPTTTTTPLFGPATMQLPGTFPPPMGPLLMKSGHGFGAYGPPRDTPFAEGEFWKTEATAFLADAKQTYNSLLGLQSQVEQSVATLCSISDSIRLGVQSQLELSKKNNEIAERNALTASQLTALGQSVAKLMGARFSTEATPKSPRETDSPQTSAYLGPAATSVLMSSTSYTYRTSVFPSKSSSDLSQTATAIPETKVTEPIKQPAAPTRSEIISPGAAVVATATNSTYKPARPVGPWSEIDVNCLYFKNDPSVIEVRRNCGLRLGRKIGDHESSAVKWLSWLDNNFDAFKQFKDPPSFERFLAKVTYTKSLNKGKGLDGKTINKFHAKYKPSLSGSPTTPSTPKTPSTPIQRSSSNELSNVALNKAQLKIAAQDKTVGKVTDSKTTGEKKEKKEKKVTVDKKTQKKGSGKRGMRAGAKRKRADPKLKLAWPGKEAAADYALNSANVKKIWSKENVQIACKSVDALKQQTSWYKQYRFVEKLFKQMLDHKLNQAVPDEDEFKHAIISLRNDLRKLSNSGGVAQETQCKEYYFYWAAVELFKENYPNFWHTSYARDKAQLECAEKVAGLAKQWWYDTEQANQSKRVKLDEQSENKQLAADAPMPDASGTEVVDMSIDNQSARDLAAATPDATELVPKIAEPEPKTSEPNTEEAIVIEQSTPATISPPHPIVQQMVEDQNAIPPQKDDEEGEHKIEQDTETEEADVQNKTDQFEDEEIQNAEDVETEKEEPQIDESLVDSLKDDASNGDNKSDDDRRSPSPGLATDRSSSSDSSGEEDD